jgi:hypothetical protein
MRKSCLRVKGEGDTRIPWYSPETVEMEFSYRQLERTLTGYLRIAPDREATFRSRIKQLQRLEFPSGVNVGRGAKMIYTGEHLFKLATAFELIAAGHPAQAATLIVERHWISFAGAYALAAMEDRRWSGRDKVGIFIRIRINAMHEIQFGEHTEKVRSSQVTIEDQEFVSFILSRRGPAGSPGLIYLLLSANDVMSRLFEIASGQSGVRASSQDEEFVAWLPKEDDRNIFIKDYYPDRSNIKLRQRLHRIFGNDEASLTPEGHAEAEAYREDVIVGVPF